MDWKKIREEYEFTEISLSELAEKHGLKYPTIKSRKQREGWQKGASTKDASKNKKDASKGASKKTQDASMRATTKREPKTKINVNNREAESGGGPELTDKQRLFVSEYLIDLNAKQAAIRSGYSEKNADKIGSELLGKTRVWQAIEIGMSQREHRLGITADKVLKQIAKIGFADIKGVVSWQGNRIKIRPSEEVDGTILAEISETVTETGGTLKVKLNDRMKALEMMAKHLNLFNDRHKIDLEKEKLKLDQAKFDMDRLRKTGGGGIDENNERILTLAKLINNPVPNRRVEDFEEDD